MKTSVNICSSVKEIIKVSDFSTKLFQHPLFKDKWYLHKVADMFYQLKRSVDCSLDFISFSEIICVERIASEFGFTLTGVSDVDGCLVIDIYLGNLKSL